MIRARLLLLPAAFAWPAPGQAQQADGQVWTTTAANFNLSERVELGGHMIARASGAEDGFYQVQFGADVEVEVADALSLGTGYSYVVNYEDGRVATREHRLRQQINAGLGAILGGELETRMRLEQRWRDDGRDVVLRLRGRLNWTRPIGPDGLAVRLSHESFAILNDSDWEGKAHYDRMRNSVSLRRRFGPVITGELGYLNQYTFGQGKPDAVDHALTLGVTFDF